MLPKQEHRRSRRMLSLTTSAKKDLAWWWDCFPSLAHTSTPLRTHPANLTLRSDASGDFGWGGHDPTHFVQGEWGPKELEYHVNFKELRAGHYTVEHFMREGDHIHLNMDSSTAVAFINRMGGTRSRILCTEALAIWELVLSRKGWLTAFWIPREHNESSDLLSKSPLLAWEFGLYPQVAEAVWDSFFLPTADLFASKDFHLLPHYCSWFPDTGAMTGDAFSLARWPDHSYAFPPVPLVRKTLEKVQVDRISMIIIVPQWTMSLWWDTLQGMLVRPPKPLGWYKDVLHSAPDTTLPHLGHLLACLVGPPVAPSPCSVMRQLTC